jgi:hypothetical protein
VNTKTTSRKRLHGSPEVDISLKTPRLDVLEDITEQTGARRSARNTGRRVDYISRNERPDRSYLAIGGGMLEGDDGELEGKQRNAKKMGQRIHDP